MPRPRRLRAAPVAVVVAGVASASLALMSAGALPAALAAPVAATEHDPDPLLVEITRVSPATVPSGPRATVRIAGTVTNHSTSPFTRINIHPVTSSAPITDADDLAAAAASEPDSFIGTRVTTVGAFDTIDALEPGASAQFRIRVSPADLRLGTESGVYWLGVHALGDGEQPRDEFADGRARTFLPLLPPPIRPGPGRPEGARPGEAPGTGVDGTDEQALPSALVVPLRADVRYDDDGSLLFPQAWTRTLSEGGRLHELLDVAAAAGDDPLTWLVDPAVPDAVARLAAGNPPRTLAPPPDDSDDPKDTATPAPAPTTEGDEGGGDEGEGSGEGAGEGAATDGDNDGDNEGDQPTEAEQQAITAAEAWLDTFSHVMSSSQVLALPFGDVDVSAAAEHDPQAYRRAVRRGSAVLSSFGITSTSAVAAPDGRLSPEAIALTSPDTLVLMPDDAFRSTPEAPSGMVRVEGREVLVTSSGAAAGGPGPGDPHGALALRQRILSEAALQVLDGDTSPLVTVLPDEWHPDDASPLFRTPGAPWYEPVSVGEVTSAATGRPTPQAPPLRYTDRDRARQLPEAVFTAATAMGRPAAVLDGILTEGSTLPQQVEDEALTTLSYAARVRPHRAVARAAAARRNLAGLLGEISISAPSAVTLSSASGSIGTTVVNGLDQPVRVRVEAISDDSLEMTEEAVVDLGPTSRAPLILEVTTERIGIHQVRLVVTDEQGRPLGASAELPIRSAQVSELIWYIMAGGALLLFSAIGVRIVRRVRAHRGARPDDGVPDGEEA